MWEQLFRCFFEGVEDEERIIGEKIQLGQLITIEAVFYRKGMNAEGKHEFCQDLSGGVHVIHPDVTILGSGMRQRLLECMRLFKSASWGDYGVVSFGLIHGSSSKLK